MTLPITTTYVRRTMNFSAKILCTRCQTRSSPMAHSSLGKKRMMFSSSLRKPRRRSLFRLPSESRLLNPPSCLLRRCRPLNASQRRPRLHNCPRPRVSRLHKRLPLRRHRDWTRRSEEHTSELQSQNRAGHRRTLRPTPNTSDLGREVHRPTYVGGRNEESHRDAETRETRIRTVSNISILDFSSKT